MKSSKRHLRGRRRQVWDKIPKSICDGKYVIYANNVLGRGSFGIIFEGLNKKNMSLCAINGVKDPQLLNENRLYSKLYDENIVGIPKVYWWGSHSNYNILVMERLGPTLEDLFNFCGRRFSFKTSLMLFDQLLSRIEHIHSKAFIHRDIKPENWLMGVGKRGHHVYLVDYGLAKNYIINGKHIKKSYYVPLTGTVRYTSINSHNGIEQSRRDDLESIGYMIVYFIKGELPWMGIPAKEKRKKYAKIRKKKMDTSINSLCKSLPSQFNKYFKYVRSLRFDDKPNYNSLRAIFRKLFKSMGCKWDFVYDWTLKFSPIFAEDVSQFKVDISNQS